MGSDSAFPPIGDYAFLSDCETTALVAPERQRRVDVPAADGLAERVRRRSSTATPAASGSVRPTSTSPPAGATYPGTMVLETSWETRMGWVIVRDALSIGPVAPRDRALAQPSALADRPRRRSRAAAADRVRPGLGRDQARVRAGVRLRRAGRRLGVHRARATTRRWPRSEGMNLELRLVTDLRLGFEGPRARARTTLREGDVAFVALGWSEHPAAADLRGGGASGWHGPSASGRSGSSTARSPTTRGARTCSAAR